MKAIAPRRKRLFRRKFLVFDEDGGSAATEILLGKRTAGPAGGVGDARREQGCGIYVRFGRIFDI
ncbi:hypothetical protein BXY39_1374 [Eilatimonas milleporae]|uniref:Uncharacterized protein n=1 Tax=Eilatimonas milleporae TaxID=911205 RepID=A0A3M0CIP9_9PROT|nr:hypothetical protein BXY39_1374 [Eilatimonas milleporae]